MTLKPLHDPNREFSDPLSPLCLLSGDPLVSGHVKHAENIKLFKQNSHSEIH